MKYKISGLKRDINAIGISEPFTIGLELPKLDLTSDNGRWIAYDVIHAALEREGYYNRWEHIQILKVSKI